MKNILTLWDIDGNLVDIYRYHTPAYQKAFKKVYKTELSSSEIEENYGKPQKDVIAIPLRNKGIDAETIQNGFPSMVSEYAKQFEHNLKQASKDSNIVLPGVASLLQKLKSKNIPMGVVTGNIKKVGESILDIAGLYDYFDPRINSYGDGISHRYELVSKAINSAKKLGLVNFKTKIYVFGDVPADVESARKTGCISVAVIKNSHDSGSSKAGKSYSRRKKLLEAAKPDYLFDDYTDLEKIISVLNF
ncbi:MAG: HAD family hydrolase [Candidatus Nanoarchaeia archaeon]|nr:HAD family hydrolase [Candidatus Nanoarchaeia archaeon]MDD5239863.1 HAD family hydrolase [Candidatus Nanoarchaeia archaeon]